MSHRSLFPFPVFGTPVSPLALRPLQIAGMTEPVELGDGGINLEAVTDYPLGLLCAVNAYSKPILAGDKLEIFWGDQRIFTRLVQPEEEGVNKPLFFYLPTGPIVSGWVENVYYHLTRHGQTSPEDPSTPLRVLVKLDLPGGRDKNPHLPGHSELHIAQLPEDVINNGVDVEWATNGVTMTIPFYPNIAVRDVVQVKWGSFLLSPHSVTAEQAARTVPIVVTANQDAILAGGDGNALPVQYHIHDEVWNFSEKWSQATKVKVDAGAWRLEAPIIKQSVDGTIDLDKLDKDDVIVEINVGTNDFELGDTVTMTWTGTPQTGKPLINTQSLPVTSIPSILKMTVPYEEVRAIAMGTADVAYVLHKKNGGPPLSSKRTSAQVMGQVLLIPEPTIREVLGDTLEPDEMFATVDISYPGMADSDLVNLIWRGTRSNDQPYVHEEQHPVTEGEAAAKLITRTVNGEHIRVLENGSLRLYYVVSNDKAAFYGVSKSEHLLVKVEAVRATLPAPTVVEADPPEVLDPSKISNNATVLIEYPGTVKGDILTYYWSGSGPDGSTNNWIPITTPIEGKPVRFTVAARFVQANIGRYVKVRYNLKRAATGLYSHSAPLNLLVGKSISPTITDVTDSKGPVAQNGITFDRSVTVSGEAHPNQKIRLLDGATPLGEPTAIDGVWTQVVSELTVKPYSLKALALYGDGEESTPSRTFKVETAIQPTITTVVDTLGNSIGNGGTTLQGTLAIGGSAPGNTQVDLYDSDRFFKSVTVSNGSWNLPQTTFDTGSHTITARSTNGTGLVSPPRSFTLIATLTRDFTNFDNQNWNGWTPGAGAPAGDLTLRDVSGNWRLNNYTYTERSSGVIIQKTLTNLRPNRQYRFSLKIARYDGRYTLPSISIRAAGTLIGGPITITSMNWVTLAGTFTASNTQILLEVFSHVATGGGNDYEMDDLEIVPV